MSTTHHEMSASGSIVVVDNSGNVNISKSNAPQSQQQFQRQLQNQQVIVNDEFINADGLMAGGVNYITTNDLINNAQIIKFVTEDEAAIIEQQQQQYHHQDDQMYGAMTAQHPVQGISNPNSKVHVISNVTIVSKPQHQSPHTISFVNSRHIPSTGNFVNTYISKQNCGKLVPYHQSPPHQNHQQQILTKHAQASSQATQKVNMPRIVTRVQTISTQQQSSNNIVMSRNANVAPITSVIQSHQVQKHQHSMQLVPMNKANSLRNKANAVSSSVKVMHGTKASGMKALPPQHQQQQHLSKAKNSKLVKSYSSTPSSSMYDQQQQHQIKNIHVQSNSINNNNNTINTNKMLQLQHFQQQHHPPQRAITNNVYIQGTTVPKVNKSKYMMQKQSQMSQVMLPIQQQQQQQAQKSPYQQHSQQSIVAASGSNIKYVNAQGNVIASSARVRTVMQQSGSSYQQTQSVYVENTVSPLIPQDLQSTSSVAKCSDDMMINGTHMSDEMSARILQSLSKNSAYNSSTRNSNQHANQAIKMTQQSTYLKSTTTEQLSVLNPPHALHNVQQQQLQLYSHRVSSEQAVSAVKFGPEYFRVK